MDNSTSMDYQEIINNRADKAHGTVMALTVVLIFPLGALSRVMLHRVMSPRSLLHFHIGCQIFGMALLLAGFGLGVWTAILHGELYNSADIVGHTIFGTIIVGLFLCQPLIGTFHHRLYKANRPNQLLRYGHIWFGRVLIIAGIIDGGLGLYLAANTIYYEKVYGGLAGAIGLVYFALVVVWYVNGESEKGKKGSSQLEKGNNSPGSMD